MLVPAPRSHQVPACSLRASPSVRGRKQPPPQAGRSMASLHVRSSPRPRVQLVAVAFHGLSSPLALAPAPLNHGLRRWYFGGSSPTGCVRLDQEQYLERSFQEFGISRKGIETPMSPGSRAEMRRNTSKATAKDLNEFQRLVGKYNFSSCMVRCDTSQATSQMARFMCNPSPKHMHHMLRIPHYLSGCADRGLLYEKNHRHLNEFGEHGLFCAVDSSFADDHDTAKSTTGYVIFMAGGPVIWRSKLQSTVSTLTCEAEYVAMCEAAKDCAWIRSFLSELGVMPDGPIPILEDNTGAIKWATSDGMTSGRRHIPVNYHYIVQELRDLNIAIR